MDEGGEKVQSLGKSLKHLEQEQKKGHKKANNNTTSEHVYDFVKFLLSFVELVC